MRQGDFTKLKLSFGDYIWLMNEEGEVHFGNFYNEYDIVEHTFKFKNHSNGQEEIIKIKHLQRVEKAK